MELASLCRVFFMYSGALIPAGSLLAPFQPSGADIFMVLKKQDFEIAAHEAVQSGVIKRTEQFWSAFLTCMQNPELVVYCPYSEEDVKLIFENGGELYTVCSLPIAVIPA